MKLAHPNTTLVSLAQQFMSEAAERGLMEVLKRERTKWKLVMTICGAKGHANRILELCSSSNPRNLQASLEFAQVAHSLIVTCGFVPQTEVQRGARRSVARSIHSTPSIVQPGVWMDRLQVFRSALDKNPRIRHMMKQRRFELVGFGRIEARQREQERLRRQP